MLVFEILLEIKLVVGLMVLGLIRVMVARSLTMGSALYRERLGCRYSAHGIKLY